MRFIELTESGRIRLLQVYVMALTAFITGSAMIVAYGYGKIKFTLLSIPLSVILLFLAVLSLTLYFVFLRWDEAYAYNMAVLEWISEKLKMARSMSDDRRKDLRDRYEKLNKEYARFLVFPLPKRDKIPDWAMIDEAYGSFSPPSSIKAHPCFDWFLLICTGGSLGFSSLLALYAAFHLPMNVTIVLGILILSAIYVILFGYDRKLQKKIYDEVDLFKEFRKPKVIKISGLERERSEGH
ncbi:MAG: hypothetical protein DSO07_09605 [Thermoproteota archaeon]|jgi:hypothetical protein|uniref:Uncharacterized protein n=1 Tax=Candidatus Methanodesulfokora washburnensis TaxID=2478471 RepID=A0A429GSA0_9CREN|nr:hypothetical protein [Candidatus Methanodesulfokores washburnensis]RSN76654.1 hypothetical protein D6D85_03765 [Candidatus Methanodesulfokores washburnensis]TDA40192.1 MAG: hypothetical protein DSO07_09605 [Candidatus Korarchaeota archaeon]